MDGRWCIAYALHNATAKNRGAKSLGEKKGNVASCVRFPELDAAAPDESSLAQKRGRPLPPGAHDAEKADQNIRCCTTCGSMKQKSEFNILSKASNQLTRECKQCRSERWKKLEPEDRINQMLSMARHRAKKMKIPFNLKPSDIKIPALCPVLGIPIQFSDLQNRHNSPSLDRIIPELGYTPSNVIVVSWLANDIRRNFRPDDIVTVGTFYKKIAVTRAAERVTVIV
jgi:hypothetical protein